MIIVYYSLLSLIKINNNKIKTKAKQKNFFFNLQPSATKHIIVNWMSC